MFRHRRHPQDHLCRSLRPVERAEQGQPCRIAGRGIRAIIERPFGQRRAIEGHEDALKHCNLRRSLFAGPPVDDPQAGPESAGGSLAGKESALARSTASR